jgi:hypothetical protein
MDGLSGAVETASRLQGLKKKQDFPSNLAGTLIYGSWPSGRFSERGATFK